MLNGRFHGQGCYTYAFGDRYLGSFVTGLRNGFGVYTAISSDEKAEGLEKHSCKAFNFLPSYSRLLSLIRYEGTWRDGKMEGHGRAKFHNGDQFEV